MPRPYPSLKNDEQQNITTEFPPLSRAILPAARIAAVMTPSFLMIRECRMERIFDITTWEALDAAVAALRQCADKKVYYLEGTLGAGKTTFVQHWLRQAGYSGVVQSRLLSMQICTVWRRRTSFCISMCATGASVPRIFSSNGHKTAVITCPRLTFSVSLP